MRDATRADRCQRVPVEDIDERRGGAPACLFDQRITDGGVAARAQLGRACCAGGGAQDMADLGPLGNGMQVGGGRRVTGGACGMLREFDLHLLRRAMGIQRSHALQPCPRGSVRELPGRRNGGARPRVFAVNLLEQRENLLGALHRVAGDDPQLVDGELEVTRSRRHTLFLLAHATRADLASLALSRRVETSAL